MGKVVLVLPAGGNPEQAVRSLDIRRFGKYKRPSGILGNARDHESYFVAVHGLTSRCKPVLYWPKVNNLHLARFMVPMDHDTLQRQVTGSLSPLGDLTWQYTTLAEEVRQETTPFGIWRFADHG